MASRPDALTKVKSWAFQAIAFAICLRAGATGKSVTSEYLKSANKEAEVTVVEIWNETIAEAEPEVSGEVTVLKFVQKVFDWCYSHMNPDK